MNDKQKLALGIGGTVVAAVIAHHFTSPTKTATPVQPVSLQGSITPPAPQQPVTLQGGESLYDPNTAQLLNTPTAIPTAPPQVSSPAGPAYVVNVNYPKAVAMRKLAKKPAKRKVSVKPKVKVKK